MLPIDSGFAWDYHTVVCWGSLLVLFFLDEYQLLNSSSLREKCVSKNRLSLVLSDQITIVNITNLVTDYLVWRCDCQWEMLQGSRWWPFLYSRQVDFGRFKSAVSSSADQSQKIFIKVACPGTACVSIWHSKRRGATFLCVCFVFLPSCAAHLTEGAEGTKLEKQL